MISTNLVLNNLVSSSEIEALINLIKKNAKVLNFIELNDFLETKSFQEIELFQALVKSDMLYKDVGDSVLKAIENNLNIKIKKFPVNGIRIVNGKNESLAPWHQDEGTWSHHESLSNQKPYTCWIPLKANKTNTLQICLDNLPLKKHNQNNLKQTGASFDNEEIKNNVVIEPIIGNGYLFSSFQPHRSYNVGDPQDVRISIDFRFTIVSN